MKQKFESLSAITRQASKSIDDVSGSSSRLSRQNTSTLCGTVGGFLGLAGAYALSLAFPISLPILGFIATGLGISGGVLSFRLLRGVDVEYRLDRNRIACDEILDRIKRLPSGTPKDVRDELWATYRALNSAGTVINVLPPPIQQQLVALPPRQVGYLSSKPAPTDSDANHSLNR
jgi:hypothetical protein